jgi:hypothetical protein
MTSLQDPLLALNWKKSKVLRCHDNGERLGLACFLRERYTERFFDPIECLAHVPGNERGYGFRHYESLLLADRNNSMLSLGLAKLTYERS